MHTTENNGHSHSISGEDPQYTDYADGHRHKLYPTCRACAKVRKLLLKLGKGFTEVEDKHRHNVIFEIL